VARDWDVPRLLGTAEDSAAEDSAGTPDDFAGETAAGTPEDSPETLVERPHP
jgi:hypothetical protein